MMLYWKQRTASVGKAHQTTLAARRSPLVLPGVMRALWRHYNMAMPQSNQGTFDGYCKAHDLLEQARRQLYCSEVSRLHRNDVHVEALLERATDELYDIVEEIAYIKSQVTQLREVDRTLNMNNNLHRADVIWRQDLAQLKHDCKL